jgi:hypothetical protein
VRAGGVGEGARAPDGGEDGGERVEEDEEQPARRRHEAERQREEDARRRGAHKRVVAQEERLVRRARTASTARHCSTGDKRFLDRSLRNQNSASCSRIRELMNWAEWKLSSIYRARRRGADSRPLVDEAATASHLCVGQAGQRNVVKARLKKIKRDLGHWTNHERKSFNVRPQSGGPKAHKTQQPSRTPEGAFYNYDPLFLS